ncbi:MAG: PAS domain-containing protein, partial [Candidatus Anammoxibacter sp.]
AVDAINKGAVHKYVEKPWNDDDLIEMVQGLVEIYEESSEKLSMLSKVEDIITNEISFRGILDNIKEGACAMSDDGNIFFANTKALNILGYSTNDEVKSKKIFDIGADDLEEFKAEYKEKKKVKGKIISATGKDNDLLDVLLTPVFDKEDERIVGVIFQGI